MKDDVFAVIADSTRRHILEALAVERLAVGELVEELGVSQPTVSKHLKVLRTAGLVEVQALGQKRFYSLTPAPLVAATEWVQALLESPALHPPLPSENLGAAQQKTPQQEVGQAEQQSVEAKEPLSAEADSPVTVETELPEEIAEESLGAAGASWEETEAPVVPHPTNAGILITPLVPFTPVLEQDLKEEAGEIIDHEQVFSGQKAESTPAIFKAAGKAPVPEETESEVKLQLKALVQKMAQDAENKPDLIPESQAVAKNMAVDQPVAPITRSEIEVQAEAAVAESLEHASAMDAQAHETAEEGGLLSKLARWGRRSVR